ncbi:MULTISPECIES: SDR family NAD(P)-dependent oxidoreductase [Pontibacillus]|uniref:SDR family oxidoreductase n=1 Tax=Pontibacillus chungwhensis TaxID=265426 RepID=A0ABY8V3B1_9BACI|nr:SDR family oxidoreductase [Pontibacillus chungwhensis]MCD5322461.1 SDR family oxidoreductase [Pontibacillus sp. HN14]WIF99747.1 SDR family oxidoreductase [Pontibacillus chungwhensis]
MEYYFKKDTVVITGASNGIGKSLAHAYAKEDANVIVLDNDKGNGEKLVNEICDEEGSASYYFCDVRDESSIRSSFASILEDGHRPTILINNAGVSRFTNFFEMSVSEWDDVQATNLRSVFIVSQVIATYWRDQGIHGRIVNMASTRGTMAEPHTEAYGASKGGILALTYTMAMSLSDYQIRVNAISPGWIQTTHYDELRDIDHNQHPSKRVGHPDDIVKACFYLTDKENSFVMGENLVVDGGMTRKMIYEH